jgi:hypothetical protein
LCRLENAARTECRSQSLRSLRQTRKVALPFRGHARWILEISFVQFFGERQIGWTEGKRQIRHVRGLRGGLDLYITLRAR